MYGYIYITENLINHKKYIGQHKWDKDGIDESYKGSGVILRKAIDKYGRDNFKTEIIEWCDSREALNQRERYWIRFYNAVRSDMFYNMSDGGDGGIGGHTWNPKGELNPMFGKRHSDESVSIILNSIKNYWDKGDSHIRHSNIMKLYYKSHIHPMKGKHHSDETKKLQSSIMKQYYEDNPCRRIEQSLRMNKYYENHNNPMKGKHHSDETKKKLSDARLRYFKENPDKRAESVKYMIEYNKVHGNPMEGKTHSDSAKEKQRIAALNRIRTSEEKEYSALRTKERLGRKVICNETGDIFLSVRDLSKSLNISRGKCTSHLENKKPSTLNGFTYTFLEV